MGKAARRLIEASRRDVLEAVHADSSFDCVFVSSGTEANNLVINSYAQGTVCISAADHISALAPARLALNCFEVPVDRNCLINLGKLDEALKQAPHPLKLVSISLANSEVGVVQDARAIVEIARKHGAITHIDAIQAFGKIPLDVSTLGADLISISAHKCGGLIGAAAIIKRKEIQLQPLMRGGNQERGLRPGTENAPAIVAFAAASRVVSERIEKFRRVVLVRDFVEDGLSDVATIHGRSVQRLPNTSSISMPGIDGQSQVIAFDLNGICVSAGSACSSGTTRSSHVLEAMYGRSSKNAANAVRVSFGPDSTDQDAMRFVEAWRSLFSVLTSS